MNLKFNSHLILPNHNSRVSSISGSFSSLSVETAQVSTREWNLGKVITKHLQQNLNNNWPSLIHTVHAINVTERGQLY